MEQHGAGSLKQRSEFWNPNTYSYRCLAEARRLWELQKSQQLYNLTSAQAATILGRIYFANGMDEMGWITWTYALELADRLELFTKVAEYGTEKDRVSGTLTAWGIFSQQAYKLTRPLFFPS